MPAAVADVCSPGDGSTQATAAVPSETAQRVKIARLGAARTRGLRALWRCWIGIRWRLSRSVFSVSLPVLTPSLDLTLGDLIVTLPVCCACLAYNAYLCAGLQVKATASLPTLALLVVFVLTVRDNSVLLWLAGISFERALVYHKLFAALSVLLGALHGLPYYLENAGVAGAYTGGGRRLDRAREDRPSGDDSSHSDRATSGLVLLALMAALLVFSLPPFRRRYYELFLRTHWLLFLAVVAFAAVHGASLAVVGAVIWLTNHVYRHVVAYVRRFGSFSASNPSTVGVATPDRVGIRILPGDVLLVEFPREKASVFRYTAGQYVFLCVPALSVLEWHPFTISSSPSDSTVTIHIRVLGDWTRRLLELVSARGTRTAGDGVTQLSPVSVLIDGCYGQPGVNLESPTAYSHFALIGGGIGITPMLSVVNQLHHEFHCNGGRRGILRRVHLVWSVRDRLMLDAFMRPDVVDREGGNTASRFFPHRLLRDQETGGVFTAGIYITKAQSIAPAKDEEAQTAYYEWLSANVRANARPHVKDILRSIGQDAHAKAAELGGRARPRVAVLVCGPAAMVRAADAAAMELARELGVAFDVHRERFDF